MLILFTSELRLRRRQFNSFEVELCQACSEVIFLWMCACISICACVKEENFFFFLRAPGVCNRRSKTHHIQTHIPKGLVKITIGVPYNHYKGLELLIFKQFGILFTIFLFTSRDITISSLLSHALLIGIDSNTFITT